VDDKARLNLLRRDSHRDGLEFGVTPLHPGPLEPVEHPKVKLLLLQSVRKNVALVEHLDLALNPSLLLEEVLKGGGCRMNQGRGYIAEHAAEDPEFDHSRGCVCSSPGSDPESDGNRNRK